MHFIIALFQREAFFNSPDLGDIRPEGSPLGGKGGVAPFFNTLLIHQRRQK